MNNIPIIETESANVSTDVTLSLGDRGIFNPFKGAFVLNVKQDITASGTAIVKVANIYGDARVLYAGTSQVKAQEFPVGLYLLSFDTYEKRLYMVGSVSVGQQPEAPQTGIRLLNSDVALTAGDNDVLHVAIPKGKVLVMAQVQFGGTSATRTSITAWIGDDGKPETVFSSAEHTATDAVTMYLTAIIDNDTQGDMEVFLKVHVSSSGYSAKASTPAASKPRCTKMEWMKL